MATKTPKSAELQELIESLQNSTYTPKTTEQLQQQAQNRYQSHYDQQRLAAQQEYDRNAAALEQQLAGLGTTYDKQREQSEKAYEQAYSKADRNMLSKGMQRSSYGAQVLANLQQSGNEALQDIADAEAAQRQKIADNQALLAQQLAAQIKQYDAAQAADILAYMDELENQEYERGQAAMQYNNQLAAQIYEYLMAEQDRNTEAQRWQKEFDLAVQQYEDSKKKSSSGSYYSYSSNTSNTTNNNTAKTPSDAELINELNTMFGAGDASSGTVDVTTGADKKTGSVTSYEDITDNLQDVSSKKIKKKTAGGGGQAIVRTF